MDDVDLTASRRDLYRHRAVTMRQLITHMEVASAIILRPDEADASSAALNTDARDTVDATGPVE